MGKEMKKYKENQTPQFTSTLNEPRSFADIVSPCSETTKVYDHINAVFCKYKNDNHSFFYTCENPVLPLK